MTSKKFGFSELVLFLALYLLNGVPIQAACLGVENGVQRQVLYAGQTIAIGTIEVEIVGSDLAITFDVENGWVLQETHVWVGRSISSMPQTRKGSPKIGEFPYHSGDLYDFTYYTTLIPLDSLGFSCPSEDTVFYIAAHAAVVLLDDNSEVIQTETAWAAGDRFVDKGMWGTYFSVPLTCNCVDSPQSGGSRCETAFAFSGGTNTIDNDITNSFLEIDEDNDSIGDFNRWGWSNGAIGAGHYQWQIYAGAGQSDISKGTLAGTLIVYYDGSNVVINYVLNPPFYMNESHLYVGNEILPRNSNGLYTVAPGQYPYLHDDLAEVATDTYSVTGLSGEIFIVAHATVCGFNR